MLKIIVEKGVVMIVGGWEDISEEIFGFPECESVGELVDWLKLNSGGREKWEVWSMPDVEDEFQAAVDRGIAKTRERFEDDEIG